MKSNCCSLLLMLHMIGGFSVRLGARVGGKALAATRLLSNKYTHTSDSILNNLRITLSKHNVDALIIPSDDPHCSEYTAPCFDRREFVSGFSGSAGTSIVTPKEALLFTDGRYHSQAEQELYPGWTLMKVGTKGVLNPVDYLAASLPEHSTVAVDPTVHSAHSFDQLENTLRKKNIKLHSLESNPVDEVWGINRPAKPSGMIREHKLEYAGLSVPEKLKVIRTQMAAQSAGVFVITMLDEIAWLFNIRGSDVACNPVAISYAVVTQGATYLFIDINKVPTQVAQSLAQAGVEVLPYEQLNATLSKLSKEEKGKVWLDGRTVNQALYSTIPSAKRLDQESPIVLLKACKNPAELEGMRACHLRDAAALVEFLAWLDEHYELVKTGNGAAAGAVPLSEVDLDTKLTEFRAQCSLYMENSFATIAGVNANAAIIHYRAKAGRCSTLTSEDLLLLDSGAQYQDGTTDITRTIHMGTPSNYQKEMFTRVLKGHIALDAQIFPQGTPGCLLDTLARQFLWNVGKNYLHGTGHGVGAALNVHEGPQRISSVLQGQPLLPGMIVSNEPGYYEDGNFGIRIENLLEVVEKPSLHFGGVGFLGFKRLTHVPIQKKLLDTRLLSSKESEWLDVYHEEVRDKIGHLLKTERARKWLELSTEPLE